VVARESATHVALFLQYRTPVNPRQCPPGSGTMALRPEQDVLLHAPLGPRKLIDGSTGRATARISARLALKPTVLPHGYRLTELMPSLNLTRSQISSPTIVQFYHANRAPNVMEIVQTAGTPPRLGPSAASWTPIRVRGHRGRAAPNVITWREAGLTDYILLAVQRPTGLRVLTTRQLIAIADSAAH
jgi:hypothetical protein